MSQAHINEYYHGTSERLLAQLSEKEAEEMLVHCLEDKPDLEQFAKEQNAKLLDKQKQLRQVLVDNCYTYTGTKLYAVPKTEIYLDN